MTHPTTAEESLLSSKTLAKLKELFAAKQDKLRADVDAWIVRGDEDALARLAGRASNGKQAWYYLGLFLDDVHDEAARDRCLRLVHTVKPDRELLSWIVRDGSGPWLSTYHRWLSTTRGEAPPETRRYKLPHEHRDAALRELLLSLVGDDEMLATAFLALDRPVGRYPAWLLGADLDFDERKDGGRSARTVRRRGRVVLIEEKRKWKIHVLADRAEALAFVDSLPAVEPERERAQLLYEEGVVSLWIGASLDPRGTLDGKGGPLGWFDHDHHEAAHGAPRGILPRFSYGATYAAAAIARADELGLTEPAQIDVLYGYRYTAEPGKKGYGWFLGSFPFERSKRA